MNKPFFIKHLPLAIKNAFIYLILIVFSSFLIGYTVYRLSAAMIISTSKDKIKNEVQSITLKMTSQFDNVSRDIRFLSNNPLVYEYLNSLKQKKTQGEVKLDVELKALLESKPSYFQIRLIGIEDNGKELVRVERQGPGTVIVADAELQEKGERNYFKETIKLKQGLIYYSEIDFNKENDNIEYLLIPTLRVASPLYLQGDLKGIIIINVDLSGLIVELKRTVSPEEELYVFNNDGYFIIHPQDKECFGFEFGRPPNVFNWFPNLKALDPVFDQKVDSIKPVNSFKKVTEFYTLIHPRSDYKLFIAVSTTENIILYPFILWRKRTLFLTISITLIFLLIAFLWMSQQSKQLKKITRSLLQFSNDYTEEKISSNNADEIGDLANAFSNMASTISKNVKELEASRETALKANQSKEEFLENMSHEIRNPLQSILGMTNILEQNHPRPDQQTVIKTIQFSSKQLLSLVNDVLDFSKIKIGQIQLYPESIQLPRLITEIISSHQFLARSKQVTLEYFLPTELNACSILVDPIRLSQILNNLLINAIKFTRPGGKVLLFVRSEWLDQMIKLDFEVTDEGNGISPDELQKIVLRHYSGSTGEVNENLSGAGLGLPIVIQLLKLFKSELNVTSEVGRGSKFSFQITSGYTVSSSLNDHFSYSSLPSEIKSVLCIDDDPQIIFFFQKAFNLQGILLHCIQSELELNSIGELPKFDLILTDFMLVDTPIPVLLPQLVRYKSTDGIIILFSGIDLAQRNDQLKDLPVDGFIQKPLTTSLMFAEIQKIWEHKKYSSPVMESFYTDYDHQYEAIQKALTLLIDDWSLMTGQLLYSLRENDQEAFEQIFHKIITTIRRFKLTHLHELLEGVQQDLVAGISVSQQKINHLNRLMQYIQGYFKNHFNELQVRIIKH